MIESKNLVPKSYSNSRDYKAVLKLLDLLICSFKIDCDNLSRIFDPMLCPAELLPNLASYVGYNYDYNQSQYANRLIIKYYQSLIRNRGSLTGIKLAVALSISATGQYDTTNATMFDVYYNRELNIIYVYLYSTNYISKIYDLIEVVRPAGSKCIIIISDYIGVSDQIDIYDNISCIAVYNYNPENFDDQTLDNFTISIGNYKLIIEYVIPEPVEIDGELIVDDYPEKLANTDTNENKPEGYYRFKTEPVVINNSSFSVVEDNIPMDYNNYDYCYIKLTEDNNGNILLYHNFHDDEQVEYTGYSKFHIFTHYSDGTSEEIMMAESNGIHQLDLMLSIDSKKLLYITIKDEDNDIEYCYSGYDSNNGNLYSVDKITRYIKGYKINTTNPDDPLMNREIITPYFINEYGDILHGDISLSDGVDTNNLYDIVMSKSFIDNFIITERFKISNKNRIGFGEVYDNGSIYPKIYVRMSQDVIDEEICITLVSRQYDKNTIGNDIKCNLTLYNTGHSVTFNDYKTISKYNWNKINGRDDIIYWDYSGTTINGSHWNGKSVTISNSYTIEVRYFNNSTNTWDHIETIRSLGNIFISIYKDGDEIKTSFSNISFDNINM